MKGTQRAKTDMRNPNTEARRDKAEAAVGRPGSLLPASLLAIPVHLWAPEVLTPLWLTFQRARPTGCNSRLSDKQGLGFHSCSKGRD